MTLAYHLIQFDFKCFNFLSFYEYKCRICNRNYLFWSFLEIFAYSFTSKIVFVFWFQVVGQLDGGCGLTVQGHDDLLTSSIETH